MSEMETPTPVFVPPTVPPLKRPAPRWPEIVIASGVLLTICYMAELVLVVLLFSILAAFILAPIVDFLIDFKIPRSLASLIAVLLLLLAGYGITYASYNQVANFLRLLPKYSSRIREEVMSFRKQAESLNPLTPADDDKNVVTVRSPSPVGELLTRGFGSVGHAIISFSFAPFLIYFMLSWQQHVRSATVMLFRMEHRHTAYRTLGAISRMIRSFIVANLLVGLFMVLVSSALFGIFGLPFFFVVGALSGSLSLVPYMGLFLALIPLTTVALGQIPSGQFIFLAAAVALLHVFALNVLYPKLIGRSLRLNPLAVTIGLLFWGWFWGGMGLILAIPILGATKIIFDNVEATRPWGAWLGE
jgi:predicted PurR-regulated permease PerM